jgi:acyl-CoA thioester hydrolase
MLVNIARTRVRYADTDSMGVVHHSKYLEYFEIGRTEYMRERGIPYAEVEKSGTFLVLSEAQVFYRGSAAYDQVLTIKTWVESFSAVRVKFRYEVLDDENTLLAEGHTVLASVDRTGKIKRMPQNIVKALKGDVR